VARGVARTGAYLPGDSYLTRIRELDALVTSTRSGELGLAPRLPDRRR
jgi:hypothetical protein